MSAAMPVLIRLFRESAKLRHDGIESGIGDVRDVLPKRGGQPGPLARLRIDKQHHPVGAVAVEGVLGVRPHDEASTLTPFLVLAADGDTSVDCDDDLDRMVRMNGHDAPSSGGEEEATLPQAPARDA
jgi:hypothetical protein